MILSEHERRILAYLDQRGPTHRSFVVNEIAQPGTKTAKHGCGGAAAAMIMGVWCRRLERAGYVHASHYKGYYAAHYITRAGQARLRSA